MFAWIGMKYNGKEYKWMDGMDTEFENWSDEAVRVGVEPCAKMSLMSGMIGKWVDSSCKSKALIVCQKKQELNLNALKSIIENVTSTFETEINKLKTQSIVPIGFLYTQFPNQSSPQKLWPNTKWTEITSEYSGLFFRAEGSGSEPFGQIQHANQSWVSNIDTVSQKFISWSSLSYPITRDIELQPNLASRAKNPQKSCKIARKRREIGKFCDITVLLCISWLVSAWNKEDN